MDWELLKEKPFLGGFEFKGIIEEVAKKKKAAGRLTMKIEECTRHDSHVNKVEFRDEMKM